MEGLFVSLPDGIRSIQPAHVEVLWPGPKCVYIRLKGLDLTRAALDLCL